MGTAVKSIVWFNEVGREDVPLVGGKGANLGELTRAGAPVPPGFIVTATAYTRFLQECGLSSTISSLLANLDHHDTRALNEAAHRVKQAILAAAMPNDLADEIRDAYRRLGEGLVAVRSSATAEDLPAASFAGQQSTFLNVDGAENVVRAVKACWASLFEPRAIFYRAERGFDHLKVGIAVPVQRMVQSERSGVLFTVEPVSGDRSKVTIEAIFGLGEAVVSGEVTPDLYVVAKDGFTIIQKNVVEQSRMLVRNRGGDGTGQNNLWIDVQPERRSAQKLTDDEIVQLAQLGCRIEEHYGYPQDIEWAAEGGQFYLLQARPVTTLQQVAEEAEPTTETAQVLLTGSPASPGVATGTVKIVLHPAEIDTVEPGDVLVAEMTTPDFVPAMKRSVAIVTDRGGRTCHAAIVSRELGVPCVVGTGHATTSLRAGQIVTVDGTRGEVYDGRAEARLRWWSRERERRASRLNLKTKTRIYVNLAEPELADVVARRNVDGVGLLRAEFMIAQIGEHPRYALEHGRAQRFIDRLADGLMTFVKAFQDPERPVVYRTTDFKTNEYSNLLGGEQYEPVEENPMIGFRGAARYIREPEVFRLEIEAIKRVRREYRNLYVMIPFVRTPQELAAVKKLLEENGLRRQDDFKLWMMAEVPSNVLIADRFFDVGIDGISIGSNDLTQLVLGIDRDNEMFAEQFDERNEAVMVALERLIKAARRRGITSSICGQAPSVYPELTQKLVEWGITSVSVSPDVIDQTREIVAAAEQKLAASLSAAAD